MMQQVGGYESWKLLQENDRDFEDVQLVMIAEADARRIGALVSDGE